MIPIIDIFAGPGGLSEGFSSMNGVGKESPFDIVLSIEKENNAVNTLIIRAVYRILCNKKRVQKYYEWLKESMPTLDSLRKAVPDTVTQAERLVMSFELGTGKKADVDSRIKQALAGKDNWVLVGGPPCQAYSLIGRVKNQSKNGYSAETDSRYTLYQQYLEILSEHKPSVFILENVKGILSAKLKDRLVIKTILEKLQNPKRGVRYHLYPLICDSPKLQEYDNGNPEDFIVRSEEYGVPQKRHRLIIMGVLDDLTVEVEGLKKNHKPAIVSHALEGLPIIRSHFSKRSDNLELWKEYLSTLPQQKWLSEISDNEVKDLMLDIVNRIQESSYDGTDKYDSESPALSKKTFINWIQDPELSEKAIQHEARSHMDTDLFRYLFVSCYARIHGVSPKLPHFPKGLLPEHKNASSGNFVDRFRTQAENVPATTITSHISKDGHYYIHPDPAQCRSLTVREAARLQTFPDNYFFSGNRTEQYHQVGNAVPPYLASQIAKIVFNICKNY